MFRVIESPEEGKSFDGISLFVNKKPVKAELCRVSALPFNTPWPGHQRPIGQSEEAGFIRIVSDEKIELEVRYKRGFQRAVVRPLSKNIRVSADGTKACFTLEREGQYVLELDDEHTALHIFVERPRDFSKYGTPTRVFGAGLHKAGKIVLRSGDRIFIDEGALVKGVLYGKGVKDVAVYGYGVIDGGEEVRLSPDCYGEETNGCLKFYESENLRIEGITLTDSAVWVCNLFACSDVVLDDIKIVGHWKYNCDGIDIVNSSRVEIRDSFIRAFDDVITLKGIVPYRHLPLEEISVKNCVLWCGWGRTLEIGLETLAEYYRGISFTDCDLIHNSAVAIDIQSGDYAEIYDIKYRNIRVEYQNSILPEQMENPIGSPYVGYGKPHAPTFIKICTWPYFLGSPFEKYDEELAAARVGRRAKIYDITFENVTAFVEEGGVLPETVINVEEPASLGKITFKNVNTRILSK